MQGRPRFRRGVSAWLLLALVAGLAALRAQDLGRALAEAHASRTAIQSERDFRRAMAVLGPEHPIVEHLYASVALGTAVRVEGVGQLAHPRREFSVGIPLDLLRVWWRWEAPWRNDPQVPAGRREIAVAVVRPTWAMVARNRSSRYGTASIWSVAMETSLDASFQFAIRQAADRSDLVVRVGRQPWTVSVSLPVVSSVAAGPTLAVGWRP